MENIDAKDSAMAEQMLMDGLNQYRSQKTETKEESPQDNHEDNQEEPVSETKQVKKESEYVKIEDPKIQERLNQVWKQAKASDESNRELRKHAEEMEKALESALGKLERIESRQQKNDSEKALSSLRSQLKDARELGDRELEDRLEDQIMDLKLEARKLAEQKKEAQSDVKYFQKQNDAIQKNEEITYSTAEMEYVEYLTNETDEDGNYMRPWLHQDDRDFKKAVLLGKNIAEEIHRDTGRIAPIREVLKRVEEAMNSRQNNNPTVLSGRNLTRQRNNEKIELSNEQRFIADRLGLKRLGIDEKTYAKRANLLSKAYSVSIEDF